MLRPMSLNQNNTRLPQSRPPRKLELTTSVRPLQGGQRYQAQVLCKALYGQGRYFRFVWWELYYRSEDRAKNCAAQTLMAAQKMLGGGR